MRTSTSCLSLYLLVFQTEVDLAMAIALILMKRVTLHHLCQGVFQIRCNMTFVRVWNWLKGSLSKYPYKVWCSAFRFPFLIWRATLTQIMTSSWQVYIIVDFTFKWFNLNYFPNLSYTTGIYDKYFTQLTPTISANLQECIQALIT